jgi:hypothetical protein
VALILNRLVNDCESTVLNSDYKCPNEEALPAPFICLRARSTPLWSGTARWPGAIGGKHRADRSQTRDPAQAACDRLQPTGL